MSGLLILQAVTVSLFGQNFSIIQILRLPADGWILMCKNFPGVGKNQTLLLC
jgi:hypothetical protein